MTIFESLTVSLFCISMVFLVLFLLYILILVFSKALKGIRIRSKAISTAATAGINEADSNEKDYTDSASIGELKLTGVDEKTAAMIMAIVSHESGIPLSELSFKSIKALEE
jgi:Na+-transporting methylmalonyl-CoA/oxaloacetate decarboxylase gamma subunit